MAEEVTLHPKQLSGDLDERTTAKFAAPTTTISPHSPSGVSGSRPGLDSPVACDLDLDGGNFRSDADANSECLFQGP